VPRASADSRAPAEPDSPAALKRRALGLLARREHTRAELARKLEPHAASAEALDALLDVLVERHLLSDARYAEERARVLARKYGTARIRQDLKAKGVAEEIVERLSGEGELARAIAIVRRRYAVPAQTREERARRVRFLQGRGFSYDTIRAALRGDADEDVDAAEG
jgi:regulatory protein